MNRFFRLFSLSLLGLLLLLLQTSSASAQNLPTLHLFYAEGCPHCRHEKEFLTSLTKKYPELTIKQYEVSQGKENVELFQKTAKALNTEVHGVPFTVIGSEYLVGFATNETTGAQIEAAVIKARDERQEDVIAKISSPNISPQPTKAPTQSSAVSVPFFGTVDLKNLSLPVVTILIAALDGFNPCAMWTLVFLIGLLLGMKDQKKMWIYGFTFIAASAFVYFLFMSAWLNLLLFVGFVSVVRLIIGLVALGGGALNLREYFQNKDASCKVTNVKERRHFFESMKRATQERSFIVAMGAIVVLAFAVNMVELVCSAGLPAVYTQILSINNLPSWAHYGYLSLYIFIFMLDDLFVFVVSMKTLQVTGVTTKYSRASHLVGGVVMLTIGLILIFKPSLLMFG